MTTNDNPTVIADNFNKSYEKAWNSGIDTLIELYTEKSILVGYSTVVGKKNISGLLGLILAEGWTGVKIKTTHVMVTGDSILTVNEYTAFGSGVKEGAEFKARSSHVLTKINGKWLSLLHTTM